MGCCRMGWTGAGLSGRFRDVLVVSYRSYGSYSGGRGL